MITQPNSATTRRLSGAATDGSSSETAAFGLRIDPAEPTAADELHVALSDLYAHQTRWLFASVRDRQELLERCIDSLAEAAPAWVETACEIKHIPADSPCRAEELLSGPVIAMRYLRLMLRNLRTTERGDANSLPGRLKQGADGRWRVPVMPITRDLFDPFCFFRFKADVWLRAGLDSDAARAATQPMENRMPMTSLVLGAGNVTGIVAADVFGKLFQDQHAVLLKLHPLTAPLQPVLETAFAPLIEAGVLRIISGDAELGARAIRHWQVDDVHITGSVTAHDTIVWGPPGPDRTRRLAENEPLIDKPMTSELGNVSPWIIVPGVYSPRQLQAQAEQVAASMANNAGFNCLATRVIVTWKRWRQREEFLSRLQAILSRLPRRASYYPGAAERFERFTSGCGTSKDRTSCQLVDQQSDADRLEACRTAGVPYLPWTLFRDVDPGESPLFCREESFVPVCAEMPLEANDEFDFVRTATDFVNDQLWGTLCATLSVPNSFRASERGQAELHTALTNLRYGTVCINQFAGIAFALLTTPWGGHPGATLREPLSGIGWVHNTFGLRAIEKTVLEGPLVVTPRPIWVPGHPSAERIAWKLFQLYHRPSIRSVAELSYASLLSLFQKPV